ncbi:MAG: hypothetical protein KC493_15140 [Bacteriovoracaceae bacterium]|nr:hypothetical protein [Bacteriovoracaceae bacterium]
MKYFLLTLLFLFSSCSTTEDGKVVFDPKPIDEATKKATSKIKKRKDYCSPLDRSLGKCEKKD